MRFKEDKSRIDNPSLTALLNIALQDTNSTVRALAMSIVQSGYAKGDKLTIFKDITSLGQQAFCYGDGIEYDSMSSYIFFSFSTHSSFVISFSVAIFSILSSKYEYISFSVIPQIEEYLLLILISCN